MNLWFWLILITAYGACVGSFLNVVIYRLPAGLDLVRPPSACPRCGHRLAWYDNIPVLGWLWLRGRCRYCRDPISVQYPVIELLTATLFGGVFACRYMSDQWPALFRAGPASTWPLLLAQLVLVGALIAATMIDARLYIIPLGIPRVATFAAAGGLPLAALAYPRLAGLDPAAGSWSIGAAVGGAVGLALANGLLALGVLPRSFDDDGDHPEGDAPPDAPPEAVATDSSGGSTATADPRPDDEVPWSPWRSFGRELLFAAGLILLGVVLWGVQSRVVPDSGPANEPGQPMLRSGPLLALIAGICAFAAATAVAWTWWQQRSGPPRCEQPDAPGPDSWLAHPHPRREVVKECLFLALPLLGVVVGLLYAPRLADPAAPWRLLGGAVTGYLVGGGVVWAIRILGTLGFGREAMGLGDVHLLGAIGAVLGWADAVVVFFVAPFLGLAGTLALACSGRLLNGRVRVIPYGPYLAAAAIVVLLIGGERLLAGFGILNGW